MIKKKRLKTAALTVLLLLPSLLTTGCIYHLELGDRIIAQAVGIDFEEDTYIFSVQYYTGESSSAEGNAKAEIFTAKGKGSSVAHAMKEIEFNYGKPLLLGECQVLIIGDGLEGKNLEMILSPFVYESQNHPRIIVAAARGKAADILAVKYKDENVSMYKARRIIENAQRTGLSPKARLYEVMSDLRLAGGGALIPVLEIEEAESDLTDDGKLVKVVGGALFKKGEYIGSIELEPTSGVLWLRNMATIANVTVVYEDRPMSVLLANLRVNMTPRLVGGKLIVDVVFKADAEYQVEHIDKGTAESDKVIEELAAAAATKRLMSALETTVVEYGTDVIDLEHVIKHSNYHLWLKIEDDWENVISSCNFVIVTEIQVMRY